ncbi:MAG: hypothetical protein KDC52_00465 [Ignavibacteriae bacterium]|nr:hypothetical protein [Ignavibacteriota bacterium]
MKKKPNNTVENLGGLKQIREIIFGEAQISLQAQIDELKQENNNLRQLLNQQEKNINKASTNIEDLKSKAKSSDTTQSKTNEDIEKLKADFEAKIKELKLSKIDKNHIGQAFIEWGMKVKQEPDS